MEAKLVVKETNNSYSDWYETWLLVDGTPVAYVKLASKEQYRGNMCICTIETRKEYRRQGYSKLLLSMAEKRFNKPLATNASFTPEGLAALGSLRVLPGYEPATKASWESMDFVRDWDRMQGP